MDQTARPWGLPPLTNTLTVIADGQRQSLTAGTDYVAWSAMPVTKLSVGPTGLVFVDCGIVAPGYSWNDYAAIAVRGKSVITLSGDPPVPDRPSANLHAFSPAWT